MNSRADGPDPQQRLSTVCGSRTSLDQRKLREQINLNVSAGTSFDDLELLRGEMMNFLTENKRDYVPEIEIQLLSIADLSKLELRIEFQHKAKFRLGSRSRPTPISIHLRSVGRRAESAHRRTRRFGSGLGIHGVTELHRRHHRRYLPGGQSQVRRGPRTASAWSRRISPQTVRLG